MNKRIQLLYFYLTYILIYYLTIQTSFCHTTVNVQPQSIEQYLIERINLELVESTNTDSIRNINNIVYHSGYLYVGAQNWLLKLDATSLKIIQSVNYGPVLDSTMCRYFPVEECTFQTKKYSMDNYNKLLIIYEQRQAILTCWTARQGTCDLRDLNDLTRLIQTSSIPTVANDPYNSTIGFIASSANSQDLLYVASTYTSQGPYRDDIPALSGRSLNIQSHYQPHSSHNSRFMQILTSNSQGLKSSKASIEFIGRFMKTFIVKYVAAFNLGIYNYFLSVQHMDADSLARNELLVTKIARLCLNDLSFTKSYTEMPLRCTGNQMDSALRSIDYNELINAKLIQIKSNNFDDSFDPEESNYYLIGLFQNTKRTTFNSTLSSENTRQAVCLFPIKQVQSKIKENLRKCYNSGSSSSFDHNNNVLMRGLTFIKQDQRCNSAKQQQQRASSQINDDFCSSADNGLYPIGGQIPLIASPIIELESEHFDSLQSWSDQTATTLLLLSNKRQEIKYYHLKTSNIAVNYRKMKLSDSFKENSIITL